MEGNNLLSLILFKGEIKCVVEPQHKSLYDKIPKTKLTNTVRVGKKIYSENIIPYKTMGEMYLIPRFMGYCLTGMNYKYGYHKNAKLFIDPPITPVELSFKYDFNKQRIELVNKIIKQLDVINGGILKLGTGKGKTAIINYIFRHYKKHCLIVTYNTDLQSQAEEDAKLNFGDEINIVLLGGNKSKVNELNSAQESDEKMLEYLGNKLTMFICVYNSAHHIKDIFWKYIYFTAFDECHCYCNSTGIPMLEKCKSTKILGLTATPDYDWRCPIIKYHCGPLINGDKIIPNRNLKGRVIVIKYRGEPQFTKDQYSESGMRSNGLMVKLLATDPRRNKLIVDWLIRIFLEGHVNIVISSSNDMLFKVNELLLERIKAAEWVNEPKVGMLIGETPKDERKQVKANCDIIFTNYIFSRVGINIVRATEMTKISPHKNNGIQINGRTMRSDDPKVRLLVDFVDTGTYLKRMYTTRKLDYINGGYEIEEKEYE
jgi:hypothetical protein